VRYIEGSFQVVQCPGCGLVYLRNPPPEEALYDDYYGEAAPNPADYRVDGPRPALAELAAINQQRVAALKERKPAGSLLDIGCGRGYFLATARDAGYGVVGTDVTERPVAYARQAFNVPAEVSTLAELSSSGRRFDVVTMWHVLEHFVDPFAELERVHALLEDDGLCVVEVPNLRSLKFLLARDKWQGGNHPLFHRTFFTAQTLAEAFVDTGFTRVERLRLSYRIPGRNPIYEAAKRALNVVALDAFLAVAAWR
jgi:SAM-dependent methyltransferase